MSTKPMRDESTGFLCICDLLIENMYAVTFPELLRWSAFVVQKPVRALYKDGRRLYTAFKEVASTEDGKLLEKLLYARLNLSDDTHEDIERIVSLVKRSFNNEVFVVWEKITASLCTLVVEDLDVTVIKTFSTAKGDREENLLALGKIFDVIATHSQVLLANKKYGTLINEYVTQFTQEL